MTDPSESSKARDAVPPTEVTPRAARRRFSAEYKRRILREADSCTKSGDLGALLRREGLYSSHLSTWRAQRDLGEHEGLSPKKRGPKPSANPLAGRMRELERENARLLKRAERAEAIVEVQKKLSEIWGVTLPTPDDIETNS